MKMIKFIFNKIMPCALCVMLCTACSKPDPILPGVRTPVFSTDSLPAGTGQIPEKVLSDSFSRMNVSETQKIYEQNLNNEIFEVMANGEKRKIFAGFPTDAKIDTPRAPLFYKNFVYAGLTTGELVKINPKTREIEWITDIFKDTDMLGGGSVLDISVPIMIDEDRLFAGSLGRAFCQIKITNGDKKWCADISVAAPFQIVGDLAFVVSIDAKLYALNANTGDIYWTAKVKKTKAPRLEIRDDKYIVIVGRQHFYAASGEIE